MCVRGSQNSRMATALVNDYRASAAHAADLRRAQSSQRPRYGLVPCHPRASRYGGRITRAPFNRWAATKEGVDAVARVAQGIRFSLLGRRRAARRRMWLALEAATRTESLTAAIAAEGTRYMQVAANLSYADALPRDTLRCIASCSCRVRW